MMIHWGMLRDGQVAVSGKEDIFFVVSRPCCYAPRLPVPEWRPRWERPLPMRQQQQALWSLPFPANR